MTEETTKTTVNINGLTIVVGDTERAVSDETEALYPKAERAKMDRKELNKFFKEACEMTQSKYHLLDMKIKDPAKLRETYDLAMMINSTRLHHADFDMTDVFTVVIFDAVDSKKLLRTVDLYRDYGNVTEKEVAKSNRFYATHVVGDDAKLFSQNLQLTYKHLVNNTEDDLVTKVNETYSEYPTAERGGPLFFKIMMDKLQNNSEDAATYLISVLKNLLRFFHQTLAVDEKGTRQTCCWDRLESDCECRDDNNPCLSLVKCKRQCGLSTTSKLS
jgi:hypothetical protein